MSDSDIQVALVKLCEQILADDELTSEEVYDLGQWLNDHPEARTAWPGDVLFPLLVQVYEDQKLTKTDLKRVTSKVRVVLRKAPALLARAHQQARKDVAAVAAAETNTSVARLPIVPISMDVTSFTNPAVHYHVELQTLSCSCLDWTKRRSRLPKHHIGRCCKHVMATYRRVAPPNGWPDWIGAFFAEGWTPDASVEWDVMVIGKGKALVSSLSSRGWADVYAKTSEGWERFGYNSNEDRWSRGHAPRHAKVIAGFVHSVRPSVFKRILRWLGA